MTNPNIEQEEGEVMDQDPILTTLEDLLKVSTLKNSLLSLTTKKTATNLFGWSFKPIVFSNQTSAFDPKEKLYANTANNHQVAHFDCQLMTSNKFSL